LPHWTIACTQMGGIVCALLVVGCKHPPINRGVDAAPPDAAPSASLASETPRDASATVLDAGRCTKVELQDGRCVPKVGPLEGERITNWFTQHALGNPALLENVGVEACREATFDGRPALVCDQTEVIEASRSLGPDGPHAMFISLLVVTSNGSKAAKALSVPIAVHASEGLLYRSDVEIDGNTVEVSAPGCDEAAGKRIEELWKPRIAEAKKSSDLKLATAMAEERNACAAQLRKVCKAAKRYLIKPD
jgi:hypothetical protein